MPRSCWTPGRMPRKGESSMQLALALDPMQDSDLLFAQQLGVNQVMAEAGSLDRAPLAVMAHRVEMAGLRLIALESLPLPLYSGIMLAQDALAEGRQDIERVCALIREAGGAGIGQIGYCWGIPAPERALAAGRGGASAPRYSWDQPGHGDTAGIGREQLWHNLAVFLQQVLPVAEACGVSLACQPTHPALGMARPHILDTVDDMQRLFRLAPSANHVVDLDHGLFALLPDQDPCGVIGALSQDGRISSARVRFLSPENGAFRDGFLDQDREGLMRALECYRDVSFQGALRPAASPTVADDSPWGHKGYAFSIGYLRALLQACG